MAFSVIPISRVFRNVRTILRGIPKIPKFHSGKFRFHSIPHLEFLEIFVECKTPKVTKMMIPNEMCKKRTCALVLVDQASINSFPRSLLLSLQGTGRGETLGTRLRFPVRGPITLSDILVIYRMCLRSFLSSIPFINSTFF